MAEVFLDPRPLDQGLRGSISYALEHAHLSIVLDEAAAASLLAEGGLRGLQRRYEEAGLNLVS
jgi:hypothetical protein